MNEDRESQLQDRIATEKRWKEHYMKRTQEAERVTLAAVHFIDYLRGTQEGRDLLELETKFYEAVKGYFPEIEGA